MTTAPTFEAIPLEQLFPSPTNPRKTFDQLKLKELADSILKVGILEPLIVRPHQNGDGTKYEIVAGERRFRAARLADAFSVPCIVRDLTDVEVLEVQVIENNQRDDVHPLEEAEGYAALMKSAGYDVDDIAQRIGRSTKYVYDRIKLLQLIPEIRKVFLEGEIQAGHAILLARLSKENQERALDWDDRYGKIGGLFTTDMGVDDPGFELDDPRDRKVVSVRELQRWIEETCRFRPEEVDLPNLFPETAAAIDAAAAEKVKLVWITRHYRVPDEARDEKERTYGSEAWKRADGQPEEDWGGKKKISKTCDHSVMGVVVAGEGYGTAFRVCVAKKKCTVHWAAEQKAANERGAPNGAGTKKGKADWQEEERKRQERYEAENAERERWKKAAPKLLEALAAKIAEAPADDLIERVIKTCKGDGPAFKQFARGTSLEDGVRFAAFLAIADDAVGSWDIKNDATKELKPFGINAKKIVDEASPRTKPEKKPKAKAAAKKPKKKARAS